VTLAPFSRTLALRRRMTFLRVIMKEVLRG
jgi:hypothetical protein